MIDQSIDRYFDFDIKLSTSSHIVIFVVVKSLQLLLLFNPSLFLLLLCVAWYTISPVHAQLIEVMLPFLWLGLKPSLHDRCCSMHLN
jgi:hypothetical protein